MFLADKDILAEIKSGKLKIEPFLKQQIQPVGYDLRLHRNFRTFTTKDTTHIDVKKRFDVTTLVKVKRGGSFVIHPGEFVLASTFEKVVMPDNLVGLLEGRSSLGRIGLIIHATAALVSPGTAAHLTFEMSNISSLPIKLYPGMRVAQIVFAKTTSQVDLPYGESELKSKYQNQQPPTPSKIWKDFEK